MRRSCRLLLVLLVALAVGGPLPALAQLAPGSSAVVQADGDGLVLREGPGYDATALDLIADGTDVAITDGPIYAEDGSVWYAVTVGGQTGYVVGTWLAASSGTSPATSADVPELTGQCAGVKEWTAALLAGVNRGSSMVEAVERSMERRELISFVDANAIIGDLFAEKMALANLAMPPVAEEARAVAFRLWDLYIWEVYYAAPNEDPEMNDMHFGARMTAEFLEAETLRRLADVALTCGLMTEAEHADSRAEIDALPGSSDVGLWGDLFSEVWELEW